MLQRSRLAPFVAFALCLPCVLNGAEPPKLDSYGDPLPEGALLRLGTTRLAAQSNCVWLPDGKTLVTAKDSKLLFWDVTDGKLIRGLPIPILSDLKIMLAVSSDGNRIAAAAPHGGVCVWNVETLQIAAAPQLKREANARLEGMAISPDGRSLATFHSGINKLRLWNADTCEQLREMDLGKRSGTFDWLEFSPDGRTIAVALARSIYLFPSAGDAEPRILKDARTGSIRSISFSHDGRRLLVAGSSKDQRQSLLSIWDVGELTIAGEFTEPDATGIGCVASYGSDDTTAISLHSDRLLCWDLPRKTISRSITGFQMRPSMRPSLAVDPQGKFVACAFGSSIRLWDLASGQPQLQAEKHHHADVYDVGWSIDGKTIATGGGDGEVHLWNADFGDHRRACRNTHAVLALLFADQDRRILAITDRSVLNDGGKYTGGLHCLEVASGESIFQTATGGADKISLSPDSTKLALATGDPFGERPTKLELFEAATGNLIRELPGLDSPAVSLAWSDGDKILLAACIDSHIRQFNLETGTLVGKTHLRLTRINEQTMQEEACGLGIAVFLPGGSSVITTGVLAGDLICWDIATGKQNWKLNLGRHYSCLKLSPDGRILACLIFRDGKRQLVLLDHNTREKLLERELDSEGARCAAFSPDGKRIVLGTSSGTALVHDISQAWKKLNSNKK